MLEEADDRLVPSAVETTFLLQVCWLSIRYEEGVREEPRMIFQ